MTETERERERETERETEREGEREEASVTQCMQYGTVLQGTVL